MSLWRHSQFLPAIPRDARVSLGEGNTPLVQSIRLGPSVGLKRLYFKLESCNPTGSYKDRFAALAVSDMRSKGLTSCLSTSSGNAGSALAAYCAAAGLACCVVTIDSAPIGKLRQMQAYGARLLRVRNFGRDAGVAGRVLDILGRIAREQRAALHISAYRYSPVGMAGVQTISHELAEQLPDGIDHIFVQAGGAGLMLAVAKGCRQLLDTGRLDRRPCVECVQPAGNNTLAGPIRQGRSLGQLVACTTSVSGLQVPVVVDGNEAIPLIRESGGTGHVVTDEAIFEAQSRLAREEGIFCEPAAAVSVAGALQSARQSEIDPHATVVCLITGTGFKDETSLERMAGGEAAPVLEHPEDLQAWISG